MTRTLILVAALIAAGLAYSFLSAPQGSVTLTNGRALPAGGSEEVFMVTLDLQNDGPPVALTDVHSPSGAEVSLMPPAGAAPLVIPGNGKAQLAMDGAHLMLRVGDGDLPKGGFHSLTLNFDDGSEGVARVQRPDAEAGKMVMHHGAAQGVATSPSPGIAFAQPPEVNAEGFPVEVTVENFTFVVAPDDAPHVDGEGHAHIYLNGLKLGRLYETNFEVGALKPGDYTLSVALNTHDHRAYVTGGGPIAATFNFSIP